MKEVFMPINLKMEKVIVENTHLIEDREMPDEFRELISHVEAYKVVMAGWDSGDYSRNTSYIDYPENFTSRIEGAFKHLKQKQMKLMGRS